MPARMGERRQCEKCGAEIVFLRHERTGKLAPVEAAPNRTGNFVVDWESRTYKTFFELKRPDQDYYQNHYVTCPSAQFFRQRAGV